MSEAFAREELHGTILTLILDPAHKEEAERLLASAKEVERTKDTSHFPPAGLPSEFTVNRLLLEELCKKGEINFDTFSVRDDIKAKDGKGKITSAYLLAVNILYSQLRMSE